MAHLFLAPELRPDECGPGSDVAFHGSEARHASTVSRVRAGEQLMVGNGAGCIVTGTVVSADPARVVVRVASCDVSPQRTPQIHLAQALAKGDRDELAVQAATELGVDAVIPWTAQRSISRWEGTKITKGRARWESIVHEATKQSLRPWLPRVWELSSTAQLAMLAHDARMLVLEPGAKTALSEIELDARDLVLVVGPEGGVAPGEAELLQRAGAELVRLGDTVLRTSTAGPAAIAVLNLRLGRW